MTGDASLSPADRTDEDRAALESLAEWKRYLWAVLVKGWPLFLALWLINLAVLTMATVFGWRLP